MLLVRVPDGVAQKVFVFGRPGIVPEVIEAAIPEDDARIPGGDGFVDQRAAFVGVLVIDVIAVVPIPEFGLSPGFSNDISGEMVPKNER